MSKRQNARTSHVLAYVEIYYTLRLYVRFSVVLRLPHSVTLRVLSLASSWPMLSERERIASTYQFRRICLVAKNVRPERRSTHARAQTESQCSYKIDEIMSFPSKIFGWIKVLHPLVILLTSSLGGNVPKQLDSSREKKVSICKLYAMC